ncbi:MAG TPA: hypothetical protein VIU41_15860 [Geobacteraceae bacterium]
MRPDRFIFILSLSALIFPFVTGDACARRVGDLEKMTPASKQFVVYVFPKESIHINVSIDSSLKHKLDIIKDDKVFAIIPPGGSWAIKNSSNNIWEVFIRDYVSKDRSQTTWSENINIKVIERQDDIVKVGWEDVEDSEQYNVTAIVQMTR